MTPIEDPVAIREQAGRIIRRLRDRQRLLEADANATVLMQARIMAQQAEAADDAVDLVEKPLNFLRALLGQAQEVLGADVRLTLSVKGETMQMMVAGAAGARTFEVSVEDYEKPFDQFLAEVKRHMETHPCR